ncbi:MAG: hypothetical protein ABJF67_18635 [Aurantimonas coralicida]|jgi:hypothetical protein
MIVVVSDFDGPQDYYNLGVYLRRRYGTTLVLSINRLTEGPYTALGRPTGRLAADIARPATLLRWPPPPHRGARHGAHQKDSPGLAPAKMMNNVEWRNAHRKSVN